MRLLSYVIAVLAGLLVGAFVIAFRYERNRNKAFEVLKDLTDPKSYQSLKTIFKNPKKAEEELTEPVELAA